MSLRAVTRAHRGARTRRLPVALLAGALTAALATAITPSANAATSVTPTEPGTPPVVRESSVALKVDQGALSYYRTFSSQAFTPQTHLATVIGATVCRGDLPTGTNNSPRTTLTVTAPDGSTVLTSRSPVRATDLASLGASPKGAPLNPQPAPAATNYRGDFPTTDANTSHGFSDTVDLKGKPAGIYTVTTSTQHMVRTLSTCSIGRPGPDGKSVISGPEVTTQTFEYRPWQVDFVDILGKGRVSANTNPAEFTFSIGSKKSAVHARNDDNEQRFYTLPDGNFALPSDPAECVADVESCLPVQARDCEPALGCVPRLMTINKHETAADKDVLMGVFDLDTKAFIAAVRIDGTSRTLMSVGTANDAVYDDLLKQLSAAAAEQGIDLAKILATEVSVDNQDQRLSLSLLNGLQLDRTSGKGGIRISSDATAQAGIVLDIYSSLRLSGGACVANSASSTTEPKRYTRKEDNGYNVTKTDLLPRVPTAGPLGALAGGPVYHVTGKFSSNALVNTASAVVGVDTATDEPNGYPVWIQPFVSSPMHVAKPRTMDFLGTGTWSASETPIGQGCLVVDLLVGTGVAVYNNPLPVGLGTIFDPLATPSPEAQKLTDAVSDAADSVVATVTADPTVSSLLTQLTDLLPLA
ncbi:hypothetical protein [Aeromicrobium sp. NPDC092404]|uniref:hypothetical protein n=1 Tax=Aeromicrobium sp. NPDC092404 TaxID=3154976 RepID=UPI003422B96B